MTEEWKKETLRRVENTIDNQLRHAINVGVEMGKQMVKGKNKPEKPVYKIDAWHCPKCNSEEIMTQKPLYDEDEDKMVGWLDKQFEYCPECGQKIDWELI